MKMIFKKISYLFLIVTLLAFTHLSFAANAKNHDGEIVAFMEALNNHEIDANKLVKNKKVSAAVMNYANMMIDQHGQNLKTITDLSSQINVPADETKMVKKFKEKGDKDLANLSKLNDAKFQKTYIHAMIAGHKDAYHMVSKFIKEAQNSELKNYLISTNKVIMIHLNNAKKLK